MHRCPQSRFLSEYVELGNLRRRVLPPQDHQFQKAEKRTFEDAADSGMAIVAANRIWSLPTRS
jgi:hypothetical protein